MVVSIVTYAPDIALLRRVVSKLAKAVREAYGDAIGRVELVIVDNGPCDNYRMELEALLQECWPIGGREGARVLHPGRNLGYGEGHNLAACEVSATYRLILNPDVLLNEDALVRAVSFMERNPGVGMLSPWAIDRRGERQYLCKQYPGAWNLVLRGLMPHGVQRLFRRRLDRYQMRGVTESQVVESVPIVSGCFMLIRESVWQRVDGFDPRFFLYFEDFDLSLRIGVLSRIAYVPSVRIRHFGGYAARKGWRHVYLFVRSALTFYRIHGWRWW
ncbi:MAG: glycosyltransferase family 2 protein [Gammaproteobacteria bacterium]